jgi:predicted dinucleotide-binding enzyme
MTLAAALRPWGALAGGTKLRIGVIGSGHIGGTIGGLWVKADHPVLFSSRHPEELKDLVGRLGPLAQAGTVAQAIAFGDALFVAVPYGALPQPGQDYGAALNGKIALDACNALPRAMVPSPTRWSATASASPRRNICLARGWCARSTRSPT